MIQKCRSASFPYLISNRAWPCSNRDEPNPNAICPLQLLRSWGYNEPRSGKGVFGTYADSEGADQPAWYDENWYPDEKWYPVSFFVHHAPKWYLTKIYPSYKSVGSQIPLTMSNWHRLHQLDHAMQKCVSWHMRTANAQISLCIHTVWSRPSLPANRIIGYQRMFQWRGKGRMRLCAWAEKCEFAHVAHVRRQFFAWGGPVSSGMLKEFWLIIFFCIL